MKKSLNILSVFISTTILIGSMVIPSSGAGEKTLTLQKVGGWQGGTHDGYNYSMWSHEKGAASASMTLGSGGSFKCEWKDAYSILFRKGKMFDGSKNYSDIGAVSVDYSAEFSQSENTWLSIYGWSKNGAISIEYYIVDSWGAYRPCKGETPKATIKIDGGTYEIYELKDIIIYGEKTDPNFRQFWSVRTEKRSGGIISVSEHFKAWEDAGMDIGNPEEIALTIETFNSSGSADIKKNVFTINTPPPEVNKAGDIKYTFNNLLYNSKYDMTNSVDKNGALSVNYEGQYKEIKYNLPENLSLANFSSIIINAVSEKGQTAVKFYDANDKEAFVYWNIKSSTAKDVTYSLTADDKKKTIKTIGIMSQDDLAYSAKINTVTFISSTPAADKNADIKLSASTAILVPGETMTQKLNNAPGVVTWSSSDKKVAAVSSSGKVTAVAKGKATITAKSDGKTYKCEITVNKTRIKRSASTVKVGKTLTCTLLGDTGGKTVTWTSGDKKIATVDKNGKIKGIKAGKTKITASFGSTKTSFTVTVMN